MRLFRRPKAPESLPDVDDDSIESEAHDDDHEPRWYVSHDGDKGRFIGPDGTPTLHLITYTDTMGETVLRLCEDSTGLLIGPTDTRLPHAGVYVSQLRGEFYHQAACLAGDFSPGRPVMLVREPSNEFDRNAVAVYDASGMHLAAYVNKQKARMIAKLLDVGEDLQAISIRGTAAGVECTQIAILATKPSLLARLLEPRPRELPLPAHVRSTSPDSSG
jgi:hypothetical protein